MNDEIFHPFPLARPIQVRHDESKYSLGIPCIARVSAKSMVDTDGRQFEQYECAPSDDVDWNWGEQDSLGNLPRKTMPAWVRALSLEGQEGDR